MIREARTWPWPHQLGLALLVGWIVLGPLARQVLVLSNSPFLPAWHMFRTWGTDTVVVALYDGGSGERLDRMQLLGLQPPYPKTAWLIRDARGLNQQITRICAAHPGLDLRVEAKVGRIRGWRTLRDGSANACR